MQKPKLETIPWDGKPITKPGMYGRVPLNIYHGQTICGGQPSVSSSGLRTCFAKSPAHFYCEWSGNPDAVETEDKTDFVIGRAMHHLALGEPFFAKLFAAPPDEYPDAKTGEMKKWTYLANYCKAWRAEQEALGKGILPVGAIKMISGMADALQREPLVRDHGIFNGLIERSIFWRDKETNIWLKSRPDNIPVGSSEFIDLKTTSSVMWRDMQSSIYDFGYYQQGALVRTAARELGISNPTFTLVFVEKKPPYCVDMVELKEDVLDRGERANRKALDDIAACLKSGNWPGPRGGRADARYIELPEYANKQIDDKITFGI